MAIKKSSLERKWYYRLAKVFFLIFPLLILLLLLSGRKIVACTIAQGNFPELPLNYFVFVAIGLVLYYVLLEWIWKGFLYIAFGGVEDDTKFERGAKNNNGQLVEPTRPQRSKAAQMAWFIMMMIVVVIGFLAAMGYITLPKINPNFFENLNVKSTTIPRSTTPRSTCPATSAQTATPCGSVRNGVGVSGVIVHDPCDCPSDTKYSGTTDVVTPGGPYKICTCK